MATSEFIMTFGDNMHFIEELISRNYFEPPTTSELLRRYRIVKDHADDPNAYLAVVGEFSSGKSTLLNAILGRNILETDFIKGTTYVATYIQYSPKTKLKASWLSTNEMDRIINSLSHDCQPCDDSDKISFFQKIKKKLHWSDTKNIRHKAREVSTMTDEELCEYLREVKAGFKEEKSLNQKISLHLPSPFLKNNIVLVDTPGVNIDNEIHKAITTKVINEVADAVIIVIPANEPLSQSLLNFITLNLLDVVHRCMFVITKMDHIRSKERLMLLNNIKSRLSTELMLNNPVVLPLAPQILLDELTTTEDERQVDAEATKDIKSIIDESKASLNRVISETIQKKEIMQLERISFLLSDILQKAESELSVVRIQNAERIRLLKDNPLNDFESFINNHLNATHGVFQTLHNRLSADLAGHLSNLYNSVLVGVRNMINSVENADQLKSIIENSIQPTVGQHSKYFESQTANYDDEIYNVLVDNARSFHDAFSKHYNDLVTVAAKAQSSVQTVTSIGISNEKIDSMQIKEITGIIETDQISEGLALGGGAFIGSLIGTILLPGIGSVIGGALGAWIGSLFGPSLDELKQKCNDSFYDSFQIMFEIIREDSHRVLLERVNIYLLEARKNIHAYRKYKAPILHMQNQHDHKIRCAEFMQDSMEGDIEQISLRKKQTDEIQSKLKAM